MNYSPAIDMTVHARTGHDRIPSLNRSDASAHGEHIARRARIDLQIYFLPFTRRVTGIAPLLQACFLSFPGVAADSARDRSPSTGPAKPASSPS